MGKPFRVLIVEDSTDDCELLVLALSRGGYDVEHKRVETADAMKLSLDESEWDFIISDYNLPSFNGIDALDVLKTSGLDIPFIIVSGAISEEKSVIALEAGAHDFIEKGKWARLFPAIKRELTEAKNRRDKLLTEDALINSKEMFQKLFENSNYGILMIETKTSKFVMSNGKIHDMLGYNEKEFSSLNLFDLHPEKNQAQVMEKFDKQVHGEIVVAEDIPVLRNDGSIFYADISATPLVVSGKKFMFRTFIDITERKLDQDKLKKERDRLQRFYDAALGQEEEILRLQDIITEIGGSFE